MLFVSFDSLYSNFINIIKILLNKTKKEQKSK